MAIETLKRAWKNEYIQTGIMMAVVVGIVFGFWYGTQIVLNTKYPALAVASGSMCVPYGMGCDGSSHPFEPTLHTGDLIIVQGVSPEKIKTAVSPDIDIHGDIIVFRRVGRDGELIVHRAISKEEVNGQWLFQTQGDYSGDPDPWRVSKDQLIGKVVLRIPWIGRIALFMRDSKGAPYIIAILIIILVIVEIIVPKLSSRKPEAPQEDVDKTSET